MSGRADAGSMTGGPHRFLRVQVGDAACALPADHVREVIRLPSLVRLPRSPACLDGIANLHGRALPVVDARRLLDRPGEAAGDPGQVVVLGAPDLVGLRVHRVMSLIEVAADRIRPIGHLAWSSMLDLDAGEVPVLDPAPVLAREFRAQGVQHRVGSAATPQGFAQAGRTRAERISVLGFVLAGQDYGLPLGSVREIVPMPPDLLEAMREDGASPGLMEFRGAPLTVLSGRRLLGVPPPATSDGHVVVVALGNRSVGIAVDRTTAIRRLDETDLDPVSPLLGQDAGSQAELEGVARLDGGRRLVALLSPERLLDPGTLHRVLSSEAAPARRSLAADPEDMTHVLTFHLGTSELAVPIEVVEEIVPRPSRMSRLPRAPAFFDGVMNLRGRAVPVLDLQRRLGLPSRPARSDDHLLVLSHKDRRAAFVVDAGSRIALLPDAALDPSPDGAEVGRVARMGQGRTVLLPDVDRLLEGLDPSGPARTGEGGA
ncbi:chemotaxis protein CheW [Rubellimicrobium arenae]|uniref:chemotaxis protein CheW n=1 Tax=Rubellimicrobium arenae TaxID=2817372 RepID=UPI001B30490C|nr:chemotaxis protein CheW [Rubellimicrobium arenae]